MKNWQERTQLLVGKENLLQLNKAHVLVAGLGGVGAYAAEMICRAGVGELTIIDHDTVHPTNLNRQIIALQSTMGQSKAKLMEQRLLDINPDLIIHTIDNFLIDEKIPEILSACNYNYVVDAIDTISPKIYLLYESLSRNLPLVSSMGAGGKLDPSKIHIADISKSYNCRLARYIRKQLHRKNIYTGFKVVFSPEEVPDDRIELVDNERNKKSVVGTISYIPAIFGCFCASVVIRDLIKNDA
jgi:tRNA threonylcarbamoyladenosine dehydratase